MNILKKMPQNLEEDKVTLYRLTKDISNKMKDCAGQELQIDAYCLYEDVNSKGDQVTLLSIMSDNEVFTTSSETFIDAFNGMIEVFGDDIPNIEVLEAVSKNNRSYITCRLSK